MAGSDQVSSPIEKTFSGLAGLLSVGTSGFALAIFALIFLVLVFSMIFSRGIDASLRSIINRFMFLGVFCFVVAVVSAGFEKLFAAKYEVTLLLSPNFDSIQLPNPLIFPSGQGRFETGYHIILERNQPIQIGFDNAIKAIKDLQLAAVEKDKKIAVLTTAISEQKAVLPQ